MLFSICAVSFSSTCDRRRNGPHASVLLSSCFGIWAHPKVLFSHTWNSRATTMLCPWESIPAFLRLIWHRTNRTSHREIVVGLCPYFLTNTHQLSDILASTMLLNCGIQSPCQLFKCHVVPIRLLSPLTISRYASVSHKSCNSVGSLNVPIPPELT